MEARSLTALVEAVLPRAWRHDSAWHGEAHWRCVVTTGLELGSRTEAVDRALVFCFGLLHDTRRENEAYDPGHGHRAAAFADELRTEGLLPLDGPRFSALEEALRLHSDGQVSGDPTRRPAGRRPLHLPRVSIEPDPRLLSTAAARGPTPLAAAAALRADGPPGWEALVAVVGAAH
jgi:uncharacterized protein